MLSTQLAQKYARAVFEVAAEERQLSAFGAQLAKVSAAVAGHEELAAFIGNPLIKAEAKKGIFEKLFKDEVDPLIYNFLMLLIDKHRETLLREISREYKALANEAQGIVEAKVTVAHALNQAQEQKLVKKLEQATGKKVVVQTKIDQSILGGVVVKIGDKRIDGSVTRKIRELQAQLLTN